MEREDVTLSTIAGGAAPELFDHAMRRVLDNIGDVNTEPKAKRTITLTVEITPDEDRRLLATVVRSEVKLAAPKGAPTVLYMGVRTGGERFAVESDPVQAQLFEPAKVGKES